MWVNERMISLGSNIAALRAQKALATAGNGVARVLERLGSGARINRASDDAAGLAVASRLRVDARVSTRAIANINDGISLVNIVSGSVGLQTDILGRLSELAEQSANGTLSNSQRGALSKEYTQLLDEFGRLAETTSFNGLRTLLGARSGLQNINFAVGNDGGKDSLIGFKTLDNGRYTGSINVNADWNQDGDANLDDLGDFVTDAFGATTFSFDELDTRANHNLVKLTVQDSQGRAKEVYAVVYDYYGGQTSGSPQTPVGFFEKLSDGTFQGAGGAAYLSFDPTTGAVTAGGNISSTLTFQDGSSGQVKLDFSALTIFNPTGGAYQTSGQSTAIDFTGVESVERAKAALDVLKNRLELQAQFQGQLGALTSRLETSLKLQTVRGEATTQAASRIEDADVAAESSILIRQQILMSTTAQILSLANQQPALALTLLRT